ncbi:MAG: hypothetical protein AB7P76_06765 [Candidatus Melainabacteria bacterium]
MIGPITLQSGDNPSLLIQKSGGNLNRLDAVLSDAKNQALMNAALTRAGGDGFANTAEERMLASRYLQVGESLDISASFDAPAAAAPGVAPAAAETQVAAPGDTKASKVARETASFRAIGGEFVDIAGRPDLLGELHGDGDEIVNRVWQIQPDGTLKDITAQLDQTQLNGFQVIHNGASTPGSPAATPAPATPAATNPMTQPQGAVDEQRKKIIEEFLKARGLNPNLFNLSNIDPTAVTGVNPAITDPNFAKVFGNVDPSKLGSSNGSLSSFLNRFNGVQNLGPEAFKALIDSIVDNPQPFFKVN